MFDIKELAAMQVGLASPEQIRGWSHGEVTKSETINYRSQKPEMGGLFCEKIFGPAKDYECHCGKLKKIRFQGVTCEKCGVEVISKEWRKERFGHIELNSPCTHIWYLKGIPSRIGLVLDIPPKQLENVVYFAAYIVLRNAAPLTDEDRANGINSLVQKGGSDILRYKMVLDEKTAREIFPRVIEEEILGNHLIPEDHNDINRAQELLEKMRDKTESFNFYLVSAFIRRYLKELEFGEGAEAIRRLLHEVDLEKTYRELKEDMAKATRDEERTKKAKRLAVIQAFRTSGQKPEWMVLNVLPVIPPDLRPMLQLEGGRFAASDLNDLYRHVLNRNSRMKRLIDNNSPKIIVNNERRLLQEAVDALIDNGRRGKAVTSASGRVSKSLSSGLKGKQGRFRQNLLGKRVDYSGRSVIAVGPSLRMYQCGLPREMAIHLLRPFIAATLIKEGYCSAHKQADRVIDRYEPVVFDIIDKIISKHPVLLNRAPTLHRLGIQAFQPVLVDGHAIRLHPLVCTGFNADFDGDQMAVHVPLGKAAQEEALNLMLASNNILGPKDGKPIAIPSQDMIVGNYYLTTEESKEDFLARAAALRKIDIKDPAEAEANLKAAEEYEHFATLEGKVFSSVSEVISAYETGSIALHTRIAIRAKSLHKTFAPADDPENLEKYSLPHDVYDKYLITSVGKIIFNEIFPDDFVYYNGDNPRVSLSDIRSWFVPKGTNIPEYIASQKKLHKPIGKKTLGPLIDMIFHKYDMQDLDSAERKPSKTAAVLDKIKDQGFKYSTISSVTVAISDIVTLPNKKDIVEEGQKKVDRINALYRKGLLSEGERHKLVTKTWEQVTNGSDEKNPDGTKKVLGVKDLVAENMMKDKFNPLVIMADSGARGSLDNFKQLVGMKGCVMNPKNEAIELPITSSYREGLTVAEFFINTHGARKGSADTALKTADSGYLTRRLVDVSQDVIVREDDCHCDHGFKVREIRDTSRNEIIAKLEDRISGRFSMHDILDPKTGEVLVPADTMISDAQAKAIVNAGIKEVEIRSVLTCEAKNGVCRHCYGRNMATGRLIDIGEAVGIMAAQSIGEPGTQLTMRVFHTGGMAGSDITQGLPRVIELVEARSPKAQAIISKIAGTVTDIVTQENGRYVVTVRSNVDSTVESAEPEVMTFDTPYGARLRVKVGDRVEAGSKISEGAINPTELLEYAGVEKLEVYLIKEIKKVYAAQGIGISDKHLEIIIRQMLRKMVVGDPGSTELLPESLVDVEDFTAANQQALLEGKRPAVASPVLLGIRKAALATNSFLSAASFQETTRVLTDAAIKGRRDDLHGLKENVIAGKLIPAGRGLLSEEEEEARLENFDVLSKMQEVKEQYIEDHDRLN